MPHHVSLSLSLYGRYSAWWQTTHNESITCFSVVIQGVPLDFWVFYNLVTQLGGWSTVFQNCWLPIIYEDTPAWWKCRGIHTRLKDVYLRWLYLYKVAQFRGKRYDTVAEACKLWHPHADTEPVWGACDGTGDRKASRARPLEGRDASPAGKVARRE